MDGVKHSEYTANKRSCVNHVKESHAEAVDCASPIKCAMENDSKSSFTVGDIVWARLTNRSVWWPAVIIDPLSCGYDPNGKIWIFWLGDRRISDVDKFQVKKITDDFRICFRKKGSQNYLESVKMALELFFERIGYECTGNPIDIVSGELPASLTALMNNPRCSNAGFLPAFVTERLAEIKQQVINQSLFPETDADVGPVHNEHDDGEPQLATITTTSKDIPQKQLRPKLLESSPLSCCLSCGTCEHLLHDHPYFVGKLCENCCNAYRENCFIYDEDGKNEYCTVCGRSGELLVCDSRDCPNVFCRDCVITFDSEKAYKEILKKSPWSCNVCTGDHLGVLKCCGDWQERLLKIFNSFNICDEVELTLIPEKRYPIRVLSLFDGIGTGKVILDQLGVETEVYYCSEIDSEAMLVTKVNHPDKIIYLGDVRSINLKTLKEISPIDLLIGGSPCNDISIANPKRRGLYDPDGTGILFFEYYRILQSLLQINYRLKRNLFWLYENVASMRDCYKVVIDRFFGRPPVLYNSCNFSAQNRARYFWGNIPGMHRACFMTQGEKAPIVNDILTKNCGRSSKMKKVRTITTRSNSLKQGRTFSLCPVEMNGQPDTLWPTEIERLFGLPAHYTDVGPMTPSKRQKLIGQGWTVPVVEHILRPLQQFFKRAKR